MVKRAVLMAFAAILFLVAAQAQGQDFPKPVGFVNDFAHVLPASQVRTLEEELRAYKDATGIELAVATVPSLGDMSIEDYATKLFHQWGIGEKGKDNGVLILMAPVERKIRIEVGYGLEEDLTDGAAGDIIRDEAIPNFKKNDYPAGLKTATEAVIGHLGKKPFQVRIQERQQEKERQARAGEAAARAVAHFMGFGVLVIALATPPGIFFYRRKRRKDLHRIIPEAIKASEGRIRRIRKEIDSAEKKLQTFSGVILKKDFDDTAQKLADMPKQVAASEKKLVQISKPAGEKLNDLERQERELRSFSYNLSSFSPLYLIAKIEEQVKKRKEAEKRSEELFDSVPKKIMLAEKNKTVSEKRIAKAEKKLEQATVGSRSADLDWLTIYVLLVAADHLLDPERQMSHQDVDRYDSISHHSDYSPSSSSSSSDSGSIFSGGASGGGGASGSW